MHLQEIISVETNGQGLYEITDQVADFIRGCGATCGLLTLFVQHTSASIIIQENADPDVQKDLQDFFSRIVPENMDWLGHTSEGPDDMPAHIKSALTATSVAIPLVNGHMALGTWQGIYLFEHRRAAHQRRVILHLGG